MQKNVHLKTIYVLCAVLAFIGAACGIAYYNLKTVNSLYLQSDDGELYLSIVRNMLQNAHFIQTARPIEAFVVPPGLPAICTLVLFLTGRLSEFFVGNGFADHAIGQASPDMLGLIGFQYIVYGLAAAFMAVTALRLSFNGLDAAKRGAFIWQKGNGSENTDGAESAATSSVLKYLPWILAVVIGMATPAFYVWYSIKIRHPNPGFILTENYVVFLLALILWLVVRESDLRAITAFAFILTLFRPACSPLLVMALVCMLIAAIRNAVARRKGHPEPSSGKERLLSREPAGHRITFYDLFVLLAAFVLVIGINVGINYLETGEIIPLEDYSSMDVYLANNEKAGPEWYHSGKVPEFASARYNQIADNGSLTRYEQNKLAKEALSDYVEANTETVLRNACTRFVRLFCETWGPVFYVFLVCLVLQMLLKGLRWPQKIYLLLAAVFLSVMPAFGLLVARYSAPMFPLFIAVTLGTVGQIVCVLATRKRKEAVPAAGEREDATPAADEPEAAPADGQEAEPISEETEDLEAEPVLEETGEPEAESAGKPELEPVFEKKEETAAESAEEAAAESEVKAEEPEPKVLSAEAIRTMPVSELAKVLFGKRQDPFK